MQRSIRMAALVIAAAALATSAAATPAAEQVAGPLNKAQSGRVVCAAYNPLPDPQGVILTLYDKAGNVARTQNFFPLGAGQIAHIEVGPGARGSYFCKAGVSGAGVALSLTHLNSLRQATASVGEGEPPGEATNVDQGGPLVPGPGHVFVCKGTSHVAQEMRLVLIEGRSTTIEQLTQAVGPYETLEISTIPAFGKRYWCRALGLDDGGVWATAEGRTTLGIPTSAVTDQATSDQ